MEIQSGIGKPPAPILEQRPHITNTSRLTSLLRDPFSYGCQYLEGRVPISTAAPLTTGTIWHGIIEQVSDAGDWPPAEATLNALLHEARQTVNAELDLCGDDSKQWQDLLDGMAWVERAIPAYFDRYSEGPPTGQTVAVELPIWLYLPGHQTLILGRLDRLSIKDGWLLDGDMKTVSASRDLGRYLALNLHSYQRSLYGIAMNLTIRSLFEDWMDPDPELDPIVEVMLNAKGWYGAALDIARKVAYPKVPKNRTKDGRITDYYRRKLDEWASAKENWANELFVYSEVAFNTGRAHSALTQLLQVAIWEKDLRRLHQRDGLAACPFNAGFFQSPYERVWTNSMDLDDPAYFTDRTPDYVDLAKEAV